MVAGWCPFDIRPESFNGINKAVETVFGCCRLVSCLGSFSDFSHVCAIKGCSKVRHVLLIWKGFCKPFEAYNGPVKSLDMLVGCCLLDTFFYLSENGAEWTVFG